MITIIRKTERETYQIEVIDGEKSLRSVVAEVNPYIICEEHGNGEEFATLIRDTISQFISKQKEAGNEQAEKINKRDSNFLDSLRYFKSSRD